MKLITYISLIMTLLFMPYCAYVQANEPSKLKSNVASQGYTMRIQINSASSKQLQALKGIGAAKAKAIIEYREANGGFKSVDELTKVKGIGKKVITDNEGLLSL